MIFHMVYKSG